MMTDTKKAVDLRPGDRVMLDGRPITVHKIEIHRRSPHAKNVPPGWKLGETVVNVTAVEGNEVFRYIGAKRNVKLAQAPPDLRSRLTEYVGMLARSEHNCAERAGMDSTRYWSAQLSALGGVRRDLEHLLNECAP